jgi:hypothetical protein
MKKTMKMSSFLLTIGLGCMGLYVLLNMFNLQIVEGMSGGPDAKTKQEWTEALEDKYKEFYKTNGKLEKEYEGEKMKNWRANMEWDKVGQMWIRQTQMKRDRLLNLLKWNPTQFHGPESLNKKGKAIVDNIRDLDYALKIYQEDPRANTKTGPAAGKTGVGL